MYTLGEGSLDSVRGGSGVETRGRVGQAQYLAIRDLDLQLLSDVTH